MDVILSGPALAVATCARRLRPLGFARLHGPAPEAAPPAHVEGVILRRATGEPGTPPGARVECRIGWQPPGCEDPGARNSEATVQAELGLMHLHGLDAGAPRPLGLEVATVAAGMLAAQGVIAAALSHYGGRADPVVETSVMAGGALFASLNIARATCSAIEPGPSRSPSNDGPGPPFPTADHRWLEIETLSPQSWLRFWSELGLDSAEISNAWLPFCARYAAAACSLPGTFHNATSRRTAGELAELAGRCGVSLALVRTRREILAEPAEVRNSHPIIDPLDDGNHGSRRTAPDRPAGPAPLDGTVVVEATSRVQGPLAGQLLRMLGAQVIRIEPPGGDAARMAPPMAGETGAYFLAMNRGKQPVEIDLKGPQAADELIDLLAEADVFLHNWRPGRAAQIGVELNDIAGRNRRLIHCHASGWGKRAPPGLPLAMDFLVQAHSGLGDALHPPGTPPRPSRLLLADVMGALLACEGVLSGLDARERTGRGCQVTTSLLAGAMALQAHVLDGFAAGAPEPRLEPPPTMVCTDLARVAVNPRTAPLFERVDGAWMTAAPWRFSSGAAT